MSGVSAKGVVEVVATVNRKKKQIGDAVEMVKADGEQIAKKAKIDPDIEQKQDKFINELLAQYSEVNAAMDAAKGTKLKKAKEAAAQMDEVEVQLEDVRRKQDEVLATTGGEKKPKESGDNRYKDQQATDKEAEPK